jgi:hypothetical protein
MENYLKRNKWALTTFDKHVATRIDLPTGKTDCYIKFKDPKTSNGAMEFIYVGGYLTIQGDYGNSSYTWYNPSNTIELLANFAKSIEYFFSKNSSFERDGMMEWCQDTCIETVNEWIKDHEIKIEYNIKNWMSHTENECEWYSFMSSCGCQEGFSDGEGVLFRAGYKIKDRAYLHGLGFIKAVEYLNKDH